MVMYTLDNKEKIASQKPSILNRMIVKMSAIFFVAIATVSLASADISTDLANFSQIIGNSSSGFTSYFINMMSVFMQPPLVYFVVLGIFVTFIHLVASFLMKRGKK